jgi:two-component system sensor histidine kinase KdpD
VISAHGGRIEAENRPGGGAVFRFTLPADAPPPRVLDETDETPDESPHRLISSSPHNTMNG